MTLIKKYKLKTWYGFDDDIFYAARDFVKRKGAFPNYVVFNDHTYDQICFLISCSPKRECLLDDEGEEIISISDFQYEDCSLQCATTNQLKDKEFELIFEDDYDSGDDSSNGPETTVFDPVRLKELAAFKVVN